MPQNKKLIKLTIILLLTTILISHFFLISLAKTEVYLSFFYNSIFPALQKTEDKIININSSSQEELTSILQISEALAQKIITLRDKLGGFKEPKELNQILELTNFEWKEWSEEGININTI